MSGGANMDVAGPIGVTALMFAARYGYVQIVEVRRFF